MNSVCDFFNCDIFGKRHKFGGKEITIYKFGA